MKKTSFFIITAMLYGILQSCTTTKINTDITQDELYHHIGFLASDSLKGRYPGTPEDKVAAEYIANEFKKAKLDLLYQDGLQAFEIVTKINTGENNSLAINGQNFSLGKDFIPVAFSDNKTINANVVFAGYGFVIDENNASWNDYQNLNIKDKWVMIFRGEPNINDSNIPFSNHSSLRSKAIKAKDLGAAGVIFVSGKLFDENDDLIELDNPEGKLNIPVVQIKRDLADIILKKSNKTIEELETEINNNKKSESFEINTEISCQTDLISESKQTYNVVSQLITNKDNKDFIVIGAHYDHLGFGGVGTGSRVPNIHAIHYGADDNASGVSSVIEIAEKLASKKDSLKTNFIFVAFGAEEMGLIGSKYFTNNLPVPDSLIIAMINIDMVGRMKEDRGLQIGGIGTSVESESLVESINNKYQFKLGLSPEGYGPSDHSSFYSKDIPVFFFSTGAHVDYHTPGDSLGNINLKGLKEVDDFIYDLAFSISSEDKHFTFQEAGPKAPSGDYSRRKFKVSLGIMPDFSGVEKRGLRADMVIKDKPAYKAGLQNGDIIISINGLPVGDVYEYMERLSQLKAGEIISLEIIRDDKKEVLLVQL